jgi:hypothetical protein
MSRHAANATPRRAMLHARRSLAVSPLAVALIGAALLAGCSDSGGGGFAAAPGIGLSTTSLATREDGPNVSFTVVLTSPPTTEVDVELTSNDSTEGKLLEPGSTYQSAWALLTFTPQNWSVPQTVQLVPLHDTTPPEGATTVYTITATALSWGDTTYLSVPPRDITVTNSNIDIPGITVSKTTGATSEAMTSDTFTVVLNTAPGGTVSIPVTSTDTTEGLLNITGGGLPGPSKALTFTTYNWNVPQTVTIYGQNDLIDDGNQTYAVTVGPATGDAGYAALPQQTVTVTNSDDDTAGFTVTATPVPLTTSENGTTATFAVQLNTQPAADVTVSVTSGNVGEGLLSAGAENLLGTVHLLFTAANWGTPQTVTVVGQNESGTQVPGDNVTYGVTVGGATGDAAYAAVAAQTVQVLNTDNDTAAVIVPAIATGLQTSETGAANTTTFTVSVNKAPTTSVVIPITVSDVSEGLVMGGSSASIAVSTLNLTFTASDFLTPKVVTVTGQADNIVDGNQPYTITVGAPTGDAQYAAVAAQTLNVTNADSDAPGFTKSVTSLSVNEGATTTFTVALNRQPTVNVVVPVTSGKPAEGKLLGGNSGGLYATSLNLTFTPADWSTPQIVTVQGQIDQIDDGNQTYTITVGPTSAVGNPYNNVAAQTISATTVDVDTAGITVTPQTGLVVSETGTTATFTVAPASRPLATVTVPVSVADSGETLVSAGGSPLSYLDLTFTPDDWAAKTVTVHGVDDAVADGSVAWTISVGPTGSGDPKYQGIGAKTVSGVTLDNDATNQGSSTAPVDITGLLPYGLGMVGSGSSYYVQSGLAAGSTAVRLTGVVGDVTLTVFGNSNFSSQQLCQSAVAGVTADEVCVVTVPASGTVYIQVSAANGTTGSLFTIGGLPTPPTAESESNDTIATADGPIAMDALVSGSISSYSDHDYYAIANMTAAPLSVTMQTYTGSVGACTADTTIELFDAGGYSLRYDDESGVNSCSLITYSIPANTTYYLMVATWSYAIPGYLLSVNFP